jgi:hypothetical protein
VKLNWTPKNVYRDLNAHLIMTLKKVALFLEGETKKLISKGNITGTTPSRPGEAPRVRTGTLRASVSHSVTFDGSTITATLGVVKGPADRYAPLLENKGIRDGTTRPFLRPTVLKNRVKILKMLG